ncbi:cation diffusion facilitator family transporter [Hahella aquimaris]|uniref:cation diffusion facilitator family transporter n=1 Tax=Hahella sp. HNIBRBA332 TaxID=3015983 RepID=UPI00273B4BB4|nr:cation diffusion facilitator family transporter [Hahella sp. HNIBRBA332]WLQ17278.1 cation diffusion facilitator family transporter [Hahella sp. HNIBRBA332]
MSHSRSHQHNHSGNHAHYHGYSSGSSSVPSYNKAFAWGVALNLGFVVVEVIYGLIADSLALITDAGHNLSDVLGLLLAWGASYLATRTPTSRRTYGFRRGTILASLLSAILLLLALGAIAWEAAYRINQPVSVDGKTVIVVSLIGVAINTATALMFLSGQKHDLNIKGAFLHMAADAGVSFGVAAAGVAIMFTGWLWLDPVISLVIVAIILFGTWGLFRDSLNLAMDTVPSHINPDEVETFLRSYAGVTDIHDLHIWAMSTTEVALTVHLLIPNQTVDDAFLGELALQLNERFRIGHSTVQVERGDGASCHLSHPGSL